MRICQQAYHSTVLCGEEIPFLPHLAPFASLRDLRALRGETGFNTPCAMSPLSSPGGCVWRQTLSKKKDGLIHYFSGDQVHGNQPSISCAAQPHQRISLNRSIALSTQNKSVHFFLRGFAFPGWHMPDALAGAGPYDLILRAKGMDLSTGFSIRFPFNGVYSFARDSS